MPVRSSSDSLRTKGLLTCCLWSQIFIDLYIVPLPPQRSVPHRTRLLNNSLVEDVTEQRPISFPWVSFLWSSAAPLRQGWREQQP